ncbi:unnamed protein product, partial [Didymodactylos carnosus]
MLKYFQEFPQLVQSQYGQQVYNPYITSTVSTTIPTTTTTVSNSFPTTTISTGISSSCATTIWTTGLQPIHYDQRLPELEPFHLTDTIYTIGNVKLTQSEIHLLSKGLKFIPNRPFHITDYFRQRVNKMLSLPHYNHINIDRFLLSAYSHRTSFIPNLARDEQLALQLLKSRDDIIIRPADKNVGIVVLESKVYESKILEQLNDRKFYEKLDYNPTHQTFQRIKLDLELLFRNKSITFNTLKRITPKKSTCGAFYILPKVHKLKCPGRPIVSGIEHLTADISKYLERQLTPC